MYLKIKQPFEPRVTRSSKKLTDSIQQGIVIMEESKKNEEKVVEVTEHLVETLNSKSIVVGEVEKEDEETLVNGTAPIVEELAMYLKLRTIVVIVKFQLLNLMKTKSEGMGCNLELE